MRKIICAKEKEQTGVTSATSAWLFQHWATALRGTFKDILSLIVASAELIGHGHRILPKVRRLKAPPEPPVVGLELTIKHVPQRFLF